jgi:hypothetical protein
MLLNRSWTDKEPAMIELLDKKVRQMHAALEGLSTEDLSAIEVTTGITPAMYYAAIDFSGNQVNLANIATLLLANIACLKDHLKTWCQKNGRPFDGDDLINSNRDVAIVHDLWNLDKHAELKRPPRSGFHPEIRRLHRPLALSIGPGTEGEAMFMFDPRTGAMTVPASGTGSVSLQLRGEVVDESGGVLGDFSAICEKAALGWEGALLKAGVPIPTR